MVQGIYFNEETRKFSVIESTEVYSFHPVTGEVITPQQYKAFMEEKGGLKQVGKMNANGKRRLAPKADTAREIEKLKKDHEEKVRATMIAKEASKASNKAAGKATGKIIGNKLKAGNLVKGSDATRQAKIASYKGAGIAAGATLAAGAGAYAIHKAIQRRKAKKAAAKAE